VADLDGNGEACYAIGHSFNKLVSPLCRIIYVQKIALSHIVAVAKHRGRLVAIKVEDIKRKRVYISLPTYDVDFLCVQLNKCEYCA